MPAGTNSNAPTSTNPARNFVKAWKKSFVVISFMFYFSRRLRRLTQTYFLRKSACSAGKPAYRITFVNTGALSFSTVTYTWISSVGISGLSSRGRLTAVKRYSVPSGMSREATVLALAWIIG